MSAGWVQYLAPAAGVVVVLLGAVQRDPSILALGSGLLGVPALTAGVKNGHAALAGGTDDDEAYDEQGFYDDEDAEGK